MGSGIGLFRPFQGIFGRIQLRLILNHDLKRLRLPPLQGGSVQLAEIWDDSEIPADYDIDSAGGAFRINNRWFHYIKWCRVGK